MNETIVIIIAALLTALVAVFAYNMIQESRYRNKIRSQFGHADQDALMGSKTQSVRDGKDWATGQPVAKLKPSLNHTPVVEDDDGITLDGAFLNQAHHQKYNDDQDDVNLLAGLEEYDEPKQPETTAQQNTELPAPTGSFMSGIRATFNRMLHSISDEQDNNKTSSSESLEEFDESQVPADKAALLMSLDDLKRQRLTWFDSRVDYMTYIALREPQELPALPRLSNRYRVQIAGCTMDDSFQIAEPIPGVQYQAFVIGLQAINRNGLASARDLELFGQQVASFAEKMDGETLLDDVQGFLTIAKPVDELCARVDQAIAIHLVSRVSILGSELRNSLEKLGFQLLNDGAFGFMDVETGDIKYTAVTLDGSQFTPQLLASQPYKGFSMLFDITRVPEGEQNFDEFVNLAVALAQNLHLELVDDQIQAVSTEWLKDVRGYVLGKQMEMQNANIAPASELAKRLFS